jgi:hypothetical protein
MCRSTNRQFQVSLSIPHIAIAVVMKAYLITNSYRKYSMIPLHSLPSTYWQPQQRIGVLHERFVENPRRVRTNCVFQDGDCLAASSYIFSILSVSEPLKCSWIA